MTDTVQFKNDLQRLGVKAGDVLLVHSSMKALGTDCTPDAIIDALEEVLGEDGTLLMPALTYETVNAEHPIFESTQTSPCTGLLSAVFMQRPGVERSIHPTHSVCAKGRLAHTLTVRHAMDQTAVGPHSPFMLLPLYHGKLLFIGDILDKCTFMHGIEDLIRPPYIHPDFPAVYTVDSTKREYTGFRDFGWGAEFQRIEDLLTEPDLKKGKLLAANAYLIDTQALFAAAVYKLRCEPYAFVTDISPYI